MGIADMNADGKDDIVRYNLSRSLNIEYQKEPNQAFQHRNEGAIANFSQWSNCIADVDKNGYNDILVGGKYDNVKVLYNQDGLDFFSTNVPNSSIFLQGSNFIDIDNDGWVDIFACHDEGDNRKYRNDGTGKFTFAPSMIDTKTVPASDNSGSYGSIWVDYDNDGDQDLYISKCKTGVSDPTDPRRVNMLLQNDGNNNFKEVAAQARMNIGDQTWLTEFADIDNDGDMDAFVGNHYTRSKLMRNNGNGTFTDITASSGLLPTLSSDVFVIQSVFRDFDNDGFVDLMFSGSDHFLFMNNGNRTFTPTNPFGDQEIESFALGDLNSDGFVDVYAGYAEFFSEPSTIKDALFMNDGNNNNFLAVQLQGIESNSNAIGARVEIYGAWGMQVREVRSGESYGVMNSFTQYFGIARNTRVNRIVVKWPSGIQQTINNPQINTFHQILEELPCVGQPCNDGNDCTSNDAYDAYCNCTGTFTDSDNDGVCDEDDQCPGYNDNIDSDNDGEPNGCDSCPNLNNNLIGQTCDDGNDCTVGERYDASCNCTGGTYLDSDNDGICDEDDLCPGYDDNIDNDNDGKPNACDNCPNLNDNLIGQPCNDNNPCTVGERYNSACGCSGGIYTDADNDGVCAGQDSDDNNPCVPDNSATPCNNVTVSSNCNVLDYTDFENNDLGIWQDGGSSAEVLVNSSFAASGANSFALNGNQGASSSIYTEPLRLAGSESVIVSFSALPYSMESGDRFVVELATQGGNFSVVKSYVLGADIYNNVRLETSAVLTGYNFSNSSSIRIRTMTDQSADYLMVDNVKVEVCNGQTTNCTAGTPCEDGNPCTTGETLDNNCNCVGGTELDSDNDGICNAQDDCPFLNFNFIGYPCNDNDPCTVGETFDNNCGCSGGSTIDNDGDGYCAAEDSNDNNPCVPDASNPACSTSSSDFSDCVLLNSTDFENNDMGIWIDGGSGADLVTGTNYSNSGVSSYYVQANRGSLSSLVSQPLDLSSAVRVILKFSLLPYSVESGDKLVIEVATNGTYIPYQTYIAGTDLTNYVRKEVIVFFENIAFSRNTTIRLRSESDNENDYFIIDDLSLEECGPGVSLLCTPGADCNDGNICTTGETYDSNCNCTGGVFADSDSDGVCDAEDACPSLNDNLIGQSCDDGNACTTGERYDTNCNCTGGIYTDNDQDGYCAGNDANDNDPCIPNANSSNCTTDSADCTLISSADFEDNSDIWQDGGSGVKPLTSSLFANSGEESFYIHLDYGFASSLYSSPQDYSAYKAIKIEFYFYAFSVENGDRFHLEIANGNSSYNLVKSYRTGIEFQNNERIKATVYVDNITFSNRVSIRFRAETNTEDDYFILDDIAIEGCNTTLSCAPGTSCNDNNACTIGETYDSNCNCSGGIVTDNDYDGYCSTLDTNDNDPCIPDASAAECSGNTSLDCSLISEIDFENNFLGIWNDGGSFARILDNSQYSNSGSGSFYIHGNEGSKSSLYSDNIELSSYSALRLSFFFTTLAIENGDQFHIEISNGGSYSTIRTYTAGIHFVPNERKIVNLDIVGANLSSNTSLRFRAACPSDHYFLFDDIIIEGCTQNLQDGTLDTRSKQKTESISLSDKIKIYPNPTSGGVFIDLPSSHTEGTLLNIYNLNGSKVMTSFLSAGQQQIDLSDLPSNQLYLFRIISDEQEVHTHKIFKL